jgi:hypothetical protein
MKNTPVPRKNYSKVTHILHKNKKLQPHHSQQSLGVGGLLQARKKGNTHRNQCDNLLN